MITDVRRLDADKDVELFETAYGWLERAPRWRQELEAVFGTVDRVEYLLATHNDERIDVGVFVDGKFVADIILSLRAPGIYEVHIEVERSTPLQAIIDAGFIVRQQLTAYGMKLLFVWTPSWHRPIQQVIKALGFRADNVNMLRGTCHGRLIDWQRYSLYSER